MSSLRINTNSTFRPIKAIAEDSAIQTEFNGNDLDSTIWCPEGLVAIKAKDGGVVLIALTSRAKDVYGFDKIDFVQDDETGEMVSKVITIWLHGTKYSIYDFKQKGKIDIEPSTTEVQIVKWIETNDKLGKLFKGRINLESTYATSLDVQNHCFNGKWLDDELPQTLQAVVTEYNNGSNENTKKEYKTLAQKAKEKQDLVIEVAWCIVYPNVPTSELKSTAIAVDLLQTLKENGSLDIFDRLMP